MAYNDAMLSKADREKVAEYSARWMSSKDPEEREFFHKQAEIIRSNYGYSGGSDGSEYKPITETITPVLKDDSNKNNSTTVQDMAQVPPSETPITDAFFEDVPSGATQVQSALNGLNVDKLVAVGVGFMFLSIINSFISRGRR